MKKLSERQRTILICVLFIFIFLIPNFIVNANPDTYDALAGPRGYFHHALVNGRPVHAVSFYIIWMIGRYSLTGAYYYSLLISAFLMVVATYRCAGFLRDMFREYRSDCERDFVVESAILSNITIFNICILEYYLYPECDPMWIVPFWLTVEAVISFRRFLVSKKNSEIVKILVFLVISSFSYQIVNAVFLILLLPLILLKAKSLKSFFLMQICAGVLYGVSMFLNLLFTKYTVASPRVNETSLSVSETVAAYTPETVTQGQYILQRITLGMVVYVALCIALAIVFTLSAQKRGEGVEILKAVYITFVVLFLGLLPYLARVTDNYMPRLYYPIGMLFGVLLIYGCLKGYFALPQHGWTDRICIGLIGGLLLIQLFSFSEIYVERFETNYDDRMLSILYGERIHQIEEENHIKVDTVAFYYDASKTKYIRYQGWCISMRAYGVGWGELGALNYYLDTDYREGHHDEEIRAYFARQNWDSFSDEQIIYKDGIVHICCY